MKENKIKRNNCVRMALNDEQLISVTGGMYHGYARSGGGSGMIAGMPPHGPGAMGPGMGYAPAYIGPKPQNPMIELQKREAERQANLGGFAPFSAMNHLF